MKKNIRILREEVDNRLQDIYIFFLNFTKILGHSLYTYTENVEFGMDPLNLQMSPDMNETIIHHNMHPILGFSDFERCHSHSQSMIKGNATTTVSTKGCMFIMFSLVKVNGLWILRCQFLK